MTALAWFVVVAVGLAAIACLFVLWRECWREEGKMLLISIGIGFGTVGAIMGFCWAVAYLTGNA